MDKIFIGVRELAVRIGVSDKTVYRMLNDNQIPFAVKIGGQWRFRIDALEGWISRQEDNTEQETRKVRSDLTVHEALRQGTVLYRVHGHNRDEAVDELLSNLPYSAVINRKAIKLSILARESFVPSSMCGIAYMGISFDKPVFVDKTMVLLAFLEAPTDFKALDGEKADAFFLVLPANVAEQHIIEMKLRRLSMDKEFVDTILQQLTRKELLEFIEGFEKKIFVNSPRDFHKKELASDTLGAKNLHSASDTVRKIQL